ncbi:uncharacterized protein EDB91DRAFT_1352947 [Suillus paluster]|uniref:uncharacterized protein n=1 Tax=Suillus paluster TaxID=48578 RepID=UPI001B8602B1|nr:uncharacterized protein EDB91DRAFT_1352947 [Suillus paluster]KAG1717523.1 hypothetical protein EDB91DRAFT_1352947 [Suillus paluster]
MSSSLILLQWCFYPVHCYILPHFFDFLLHTAMLPSTPPTSPQRAQSVARQAERNQRNLGSPPARRLPQNDHAPVAPDAPHMNIPHMLGNLNHAQIPVQRFPGIPRNAIERHEAHRQWRAHHPPPPPLLQALAIFLLLLLLLLSILQGLVAITPPPVPAPAPPPVHPLLKCQCMVLYIMRVQLALKTCRMPIPFSISLVFREYELELTITSI